MIILWISVLFVVRSKGDQPSNAYDALEDDIRTTMNASVDPCMDFYEFACGGWLTASTESLSSSKNKVAKSFTETTDTNQAILYDLIRRNATDERVRVFMQSCMDLKSIEEHGLDSPTMTRFLDEIDAIESLEDVLQAAGRLRQINGAFVIGSDVVVNTQHPQRYILSLRPAGLIMKNPNIYKSAQNPKLIAYQQHVARMLSMFEDDDAEYSAAAIVAFERQMYAARKIKQPSTARSNVSSTESQMSLTEFSQSTKLNWGLYLKAAGITLNDDDCTVVVKYANVMKRISAIVRSTPASTLKAFLKWTLISDLSPFLPDQIRQADFEFFQKRLLGKQTLGPRWRYCTELADQHLPELTGPAFIKAKFSPEAKAEATEILNTTMIALASQFQQLQWMDQATTALAIDKIAHMKALIGYPDRWETSIYDGIDFNTKISFVEMMQQVLMNEWLQSVIGLTGKVNRNKWTKPVTTVNAYYTPTLNAITLPAGILQQPFFNTEYPITMNFGGIGFIMTHELVHGFDDKGRQYNKQGGLKKWWPGHVLKAYQQRVQCYRQQYSQMRDNDPISGNLTVNANQTMGENIADNGAVDLGLSAMRLYLETHPDMAPILPEFTLEQTYFLTVAQMFCSRTRPELAKMLQATNPHPPSRVRINAIMANSDLFSDAYQCPSGTPMNPVQKCDLWRR